MTRTRALFTTLASCALAAAVGSACGHDELWLGADAGLESTGGVASKPGGPDASSGGTTSSGGAAGAGAGDASGDGLAGSAGALADASDAAEAGNDADASDAPGAVVPDFKLLDENPASALYKKQVSPRDYLGQVSAWYFGHAT